MDFVTITDHDSLDGVLKLTDRPDVIVGEEVTCYFPEDHCKIHLLVWGLDPTHHAAIQAVANDIYKVPNMSNLRILLIRWRIPFIGKTMFWNGGISAPGVDVQGF